MLDSILLYSVQAQPCLRLAVIPTIPLRGGGVMVTYSELIQFVIMLVTFAGLIIQISDKRKWPPSFQTSGHFQWLIRGSNRQPAAPFSILSIARLIQIVKVALDVGFCYTQFRCYRASGRRLSLAPERGRAYMNYEAMILLLIVATGYIIALKKK